ncbi:MAG TPA: primosomal protein N', partial [Candidatus Saccharimonadales bacterium]|nr:primosomal protein N' [Candidatus Saccharimonadales bacterium]
MRYYLVWVRSQKYRGHDPLTYAYDGELAAGTVVLVELQRELVLGFVAGEVAKPSFATKPLRTVFDLPPLPPQVPQLAAWLQAFYATTLGVAAQQLLPPLLSEKTARDYEPVVANTISGKLPPLTDDQTTVVNNIKAADTYVLHGKTGSGKTRVYLDVALTTVTAGRSVLVLTPEISLTSQLARGFQAVFGNQVLILHSQLTPQERRTAWLRILTAEVPVVVIGPRSALFSPFRNLGLVVVDESHEGTYKQEQAPYYHAVRVASQLAHLHGATLVLGSATPSVSDYFLAEQRGKPILKMTALAAYGAPGSSEAERWKVEGGNPESTFQNPASSTSKVDIVDLKDRGQFSRSQLLSAPLVNAVQAALGRGEQSLIYLNRRGTARVVLCENCGWQAVCPHCDLPLTYHADASQFRCHTCGYHEPLRVSCPVCGHPNVLFKSFGTKALADEVQRLFPEARVQRFDTDNKKDERFERHYEAVRAGEVDILVGTQLLAKGLDLPRLSTLGVVLADSSLYLPDFSASERTYQLLTQVLGRVGRGHVQGHAVVQTYHPESPILADAIAG